MPEEWLLEQIEKRTGIRITGAGWMSVLLEGIVVMSLLLHRSGLYSPLRWNDSVRDRHESSVSSEAQ